MEQLSWPRGSGLHIFNTISTSDHGESDRRQGRKDLSHPRNCKNEASASGRQTKSRRNHKYFSHSHHHHRLNHLNKRAFRYEVDTLEQRFPIKKQKDENLEFTGKTKSSLSFSSRKSRKQEVRGRLGVFHADINKRKAHITLLQHELHPCISAGVAGNYCSRTIHQTHAIPDFATLPDDFATLPDDILLRVMGSFNWKDLWSASRVCRSWCKALTPLREAMYFVHWGKRFKHGRGGITRNVDKAMHSFLNGTKRGCTAAMVDAGLLLWEMGQKQEGLYWYKQAAQLGDPAGECNLGLALLQDSSNAVEAVKWFQRAAVAGHVRAQYCLALCLQQGKGVDCSIVKAARWYQQAAEGGSSRAMYNLALCYRKGEGLTGDFQIAKKWMKRAALAGHPKAQFEHGLTLFAENEGGLALVFLELATRGGETAATHLRDTLIQQLSPKMRTHAINCADKWQAKLGAQI